MGAESVPGLRNRYSTPCAASRYTRCSAVVFTAGTSGAAADPAYSADPAGVPLTESVRIHSASLQYSPERGCVRPRLRAARVSRSVRMISRGPPLRQRRPCATPRAGLRAWRGPRRAGTRPESTRPEGGERPLVGLDRAQADRHLHGTQLVEHLVAVGGADVGDHIAQVVAGAEQLPLDVHPVL